ncbi:hypothetical protein [Herbaspirillum sp. NPDC101396]|uniref:hypothetical protein n=1 Tax=Herbaspirillum sp. NPDC101396 TaxID=3364005 RepID=UPI003839D777
MPKEIHSLGSPGWLDHVFHTPPVRALKGRSKFTQYHQFWSRNLGRYVGGQGRNEALAALTLEYLITLGYISKFKEQPFKTEPQTFGAQIVPDFIAVAPCKKIYVIEVKSARFITRFIQASLDRNREVFQQAGLAYVCWTDQHPLNVATRHNLINMHRHSNSVQPDECVAFAKHLEALGTLSVEELQHHGYDYGVIYAATWSGKTFFPITREFTATTSVSTRPIIDIPAVFLDARCEVDRWWDSLEGC